MNKCLISEGCFGVYDWVVIVAIIFIVGMVGLRLLSSFKQNKNGGGK